MKGGKTPIHIMRWAPADFLCDPFVLMLVSNGMWETYVFYRQFIDVSLPLEVRKGEAALGQDGA